MRILTVSAFYEDHGGGIEIVAGSLARALGRRGHQCCWAAAAFDRPPTDSGLHPVPLAASDRLERWTGLPLPLLHRSGRRRLKEEIAGADAVVIHDALYVSSILAARYAAKQGKPWAIVQHIGLIPYKNPLLRLAMATANRILTVPLLESAPVPVFISDAVRSCFRRARWRTPPALLFNGVDHKLFQPPTAASRKQLRMMFGMSDERRQILFVGRFVEKKGLSAVRTLAATRPDWDFWLAGGGPIDPTAWQLANVRVLGRKSREDLADLYRAADGSRWSFRRPWRLDCRSSAGWIAQPPTQTPANC
jgi:starch synthase